MALIARLRTLRCLKTCYSCNVALKNWPHYLKSQPPYFTRHSSFWTKVTRAFQKPSQKDFKIKDNVPDTFVLIYRNTMSKYIMWAQVVTFVSGGLVFLALATQSEYQPEPPDIEEWSRTAVTTPNEQIFFVGSFILFLVLLQLMVTRTPLRIYKIPRSPKYVAISYGNFLGLEKYTFLRGEIVQLEESGVLPWRENRFLIEKENDRRYMYLLDHYFRRPGDLSIMLCEQKDPDLED